MYVPSSKIAAQIRYAPTSNCTWTIAQWNQGAAGGLWYDRNLQYPHGPGTSQPTTPSPIPEYVVVDPGSSDSQYGFSLFGDGKTPIQTLIENQGFTPPTLYSQTTSAPGALLSPSNVTFSSTGTGVESAPEDVTLVNYGTAPLVISSITTTQGYTATDDCGGTVAAGGNCTITIVLTPQSGTTSGTLWVNDNASGSPQTAMLFGMAGVATNVSALTFASQLVGTSSMAEMVNLANNSGSVWNINSVSPSGDFSQTNNCGSSLANGSNCAISVVFSPAAAGTRSGTLTIAGGSGSPQTVQLSGTGTSANAGSACTSGSSSSFPACLALTSPTAVVAANSSGNVVRAPVAGASGMPVRPRTPSSSFQTAFSADTAQIAALLGGTDSTPGATLGTLGNAAFQGALVSQQSNFCFNPLLFYANHPEAGTYNFPASGSIPGVGIWTKSDSAGQACAASELNFLMTSTSGFAQLGLALAAEMNFLAGSSLPASNGDSVDVAAGLNGLLQAAAAAAGPFDNISSATIAYDGTTYTYTVQFTAHDFGSNYNCTVILKQTPGVDQYTYSGVLQFLLDDGTTATVGSMRYQRAGQTLLNLSARATHYPTGSIPTPDANGELDPTDNNWILGFSRFGASFDPTSAYLTGKYAYAKQDNAPNSPGPQGGQVTVFQVMLNADGTGGAFFGRAGVTINQPTSWVIDHMTCLHMGQADVHHLYAQYQPFQFDATGGQYIAATSGNQIRYAPTSDCQWPDTQWNGGTDASGFWYDRPLQFANNNPSNLPATPSPIPQYVVVDPTDSNYAFHLFGDDQTAVQTLINQQGFSQLPLF